MEETSAAGSNEASYVGQHPNSRKPEITDFLSMLEEGALPDARIGVARVHRIPFPGSVWALNASFWRDIRQDECNKLYANNLKILSDILSSLSMMKEAPRFEIYVEMLFDELFCPDGYVIWILSYDHQRSVDLNGLYQNWINKNSAGAHAYVANERGKRFFNNPEHDELSNIVTPRDVVMRALLPWIRNGDMNEASKVSQAVRADTISELSSTSTRWAPDDLFSPDTSFRMFCRRSGIGGGRQHDSSLYIHPDLPGGAPVFPFPQFVWRIRPRYWTRAILDAAPLPYFIHEAIYGPSFPVSGHVILQEEDDRLHQCGTRIDIELMDDDIMNIENDLFGVDDDDDDDRGSLSSTGSGSILPGSSENTQTAILDSHDFRSGSTTSTGHLFRMAAAATYRPDKVSFYDRIRLLQGKLEHENKKRNRDCSIGKIDVIAAQTNETIELRLKSKETLDRILAFVSDITTTPEGRRESIEGVMARHKANTMEKFWEIFFHSPKVTDVIKAARAFWKKVPLGQQWIEVNQSTRKLTPYGNMRAQMTTDFNTSFHLKGHHRFLVLMLLSMLSASQYSYSVKPNILLTGDPGIGKSYLNTLLLAMAFPGQATVVNHVTPQSISGGKEFSDGYHLIDDAPNIMTGMDTAGNKCEEHPVIKSQMTTQQVTTMAYQPTKDGQRGAIVQATRQMFGQSACTNVGVDRDSPLVQRSIPLHITSSVRKDIDPLDTIFCTSHLSDERVDRRTKDKYNLWCFYVFIWNKAIEAGAMSEISTDNARIVAEQVLRALPDCGSSKRIQQRKVEQVLDLARSMTQLYGIYIQFFSEISPFRSVPPGKPCFDTKALASLEKYSVVTEEIILDVLTLCLDEWVPGMKTSHILKAIMQRSKEQAATEDGMPCFMRVAADTPAAPPPSTTAAAAAAMSEDPAANASQSHPRPPSGSPLEMDYRYIEVTDTSVRGIFSHIASSMKDPRYARNDIEQICYGLARNSFIDSHEYTSRGKKENSDGQDKLKKIPTVIIDTDPRDRTRRRLCLARAALESENLCSDIIPTLRDALAPFHDKRKETFLITGIPREGYPSLFELVHIEARQEEEPQPSVEVRNGFAHSIVSRAFMDNTLQSGSDEGTLFDREDPSNLPTKIIAGPIEPRMFADFWILESVTGSETELRMAIPELAKEMIWSKRREDKRYERLNVMAQLVHDYPHAFEEEMSSRFKAIEQDEHSASSRGTKRPSLLLSDTLPPLNSSLEDHLNSIRSLNDWEATERRGRSKKELLSIIETQSTNKRRRFTGPAAAKALGF